MQFLVKLNPEYSSQLLVEAKATYALFLFLLSAMKKAVIVLFCLDTKILTADCTAGSAAVCKACVLNTPSEIKEWIEASCQLVWKTLKLLDFFNQLTTQITVKKGAQDLDFFLELLFISGIY